MSEWVAVVSEEGDEPIEIPTESDGTMLLSTLSAQFPKVTGLKFRNPESNNLRGVRCHDNTLFPPFKAADAGQESEAATEGHGTWGGLTYICNLPPSAMKITKKVLLTYALTCDPIRDPTRLTKCHLIQMGHNVSLQSAMPLLKYP